MVQRWSRGELDETKTELSERTLPIPEALVERIRAAITHNRREALRRGLPESRFLFPGWRENGDAPMDEHGLSKRFAKLLKTARVPPGTMPFHRLRHTYASRLLESSVPIPRVSKLLGHASISITVNTYGHLLEDFDDSAVMDRIALLDTSPSTSRTPTTQR